MSEELKPCPFCGGKAEWNIGKTGKGENWYYLACLECEAMSPYRSCQREGVIIDWNNRPIEDALNQRITELESQLAELRKAGEWQPIETAPMDGTSILGWCKAWDKDVIQVRYLTGLGKWNTTMQPTHWLPLPQPDKGE